MISRTFPWIYNIYPPKKTETLNSELVNTWARLIENGKSNDYDAKRCGGCNAFLLLSPETESVVCAAGEDPWLSRMELDVQNTFK